MHLNQKPTSVLTVVNKITSIPTAENQRSADLVNYIDLKSLLTEAVAVTIDAQKVAKKP